MNVWINNPFDNLPGEGRRPQRYNLLCRALAKAGHTVTWWSSDFSHATKRLRRLPPVYDAPEGFRVRLVPTLPYFDNVGFRRARSHRLYAADWEEMALDGVEHGAFPKPDLVLTSWPPMETADVARRFRDRWGCKVVLDVMDAWPENFARLIPGPDWLRDILWRLFCARAIRRARRAYRGADAVSAVGVTYLGLAMRYGCRAPRHLCYHGIMRMNNGATRYSLDETEPLRLIYVGNMGRSYDLSTVVRAVRDLYARGENIRLDLAGTGPREPLLRREAAACPAIRFHGYLSNEDMQQLLADSDLAVVPMFPDSRVAVPYKLADYTAAGLPMICCLTGETQALIERYGAGTQYRAGDQADFTRVLTAYLHQRSRLTREALASARLARESFMMDTIYPEFVRFLEEICRCQNGETQRNTEECTEKHRGTQNGQA